MEKYIVYLLKKKNMKKLCRRTIIFMIKKKEYFILTRDILTKKLIYNNNFVLEYIYFGNQVLYLSKIEKTNTFIIENSHIIDNHIENLENIKNYFLYKKNMNKGVEHIGYKNIDKSKQTQSVSLFKEIGEFSVYYQNEKKESFEFCEDPEKIYKIYWDNIEHCLKKRIRRLSKNKKRRNIYRWNLY